MTPPTTQRPRTSGPDTPVGCFVVPVERVNPKGRTMTKIGIVLGSTRPGRLGDQVAQWVHERAARRGDAGFALVDLRDHPLPHLEEPPGFSGEYQDERT